MYQFNGATGSDYQHPQYPQPGGFNNHSQFQLTQPNQAYPQPQNPSMQQQQYQASPQTAQTTILQHPNLSPVHQNQAHTVNGHGFYHQQPTSRNDSYQGNPQFASQQSGTYGPVHIASIPQRSASFRLQATAPNNPFPPGQPRQASQVSPIGHPNSSSESCYNCGAPDHWAQDCPEPRRAVPAGQKNRSFKRQKTHGVTLINNHQTIQQQPPHLQRGWTDPAVAQRSFSMSSIGSNAKAATFSEQRPWIHNPNQKPRMSSALSDSVLPGLWTQQQSHQSSFTPQSTATSRQGFWSQPQFRQPGDATSAGTSYLPWSNQQPNQTYSSISPMTVFDTQTSWNSQQSGFNNGTLPPKRAGDQTAGNPHDAQADGISATHAMQWSAQNLPTPAPSVESQIQSPVKSNLNSVDQYTQQTPRYTESPRNRHDSVSSASKKNQDPRTQQAEMVANLFSAEAQIPVSETSPPENLTAKDDSSEETEEGLAELYGLDFPDVIFNQDLTVVNPAIPVADPLSSTHEFGTNDETSTANTSVTGAPLSKYLRGLREEDFFKNVQETSEWDLLKDDPIFAKIKANTTTVTFTELIERRRLLLEALTEADEDDQEDDHQHQETEEERLEREQEERLAALGVTGSAKPVKASPTDIPFAGTPSPTETLVAGRVSGDPGWKHYENGRAVDHRSTSFESSASAAKDSRSVSSTRHHSPLDVMQGKSANISPNTDRPEQQPYRKRTYSEASEEVDDIPRRYDAELKQRKPRLKQPKVAAAYGRRW